MAIPLISLLLLITSLTTTTATTTIGVTYSTPTTLLSPDKLAAKLVSLNIKSIRLLDSNPTLIRSFAYTNISLFLSIPNPLIPLLASNRSLASRWIYRHVLPFHPRVKISLISVGNDPISYSPDVSPFLLRAMQNIHVALTELRIFKISVSTTFSFFNVITSPFPPSSATFENPNGDVIIRPILTFLERTNSSFLVNLYPYNMYRSRFEIPVGLALFEEYAFGFRDDLVTGVRYRNLFDMMVDAVISSMAVMGHEGMRVVVAETGWPSSGIDGSEVDATLLYSEMYLKGLVEHLRSGSGTPLRKEGVSEVYLFELLDKDDGGGGGGKGGVRNWGVLHRNMSEKYGFELSGCGGGRKELLVWLFLEAVMVLYLFM